MIIVNEAIKYLGMHDGGDVRVAVQGMGNVGGVAAQLLHDCGRKIVAVSDISGGYYNPEGLDITAMRKYIAESDSHTLEGYTAPGCRKISNAELIACDCDVLVPCALQNQITGDNADTVKAKLVVEGAERPDDG